MNAPIAPARTSTRFVRLFGWYACRLLRKRFACVRLERASEPLLRSASSHEGPLIIAMNHPSWWDPIVGMSIKHRYLGDRPGVSPIDMAMFERFGFMRRLGMFGLDASHPGALPAMTRYVREQCERDPRTALFITPQGAFADVREKLVVRPGVGAIAAALQNVRVIAMGVEPVFWEDKRPELLLRVGECPSPESPTTASWTRAIRRAMQSNADGLAQLALARDESAFIPMLARAGSDVNPAYDLWQRMRGRSARITPAGRGARA